jgi:hypothetical protein
MSRTIIQKCKRCNNEFNAEIREINRNNGKYCSLSCSAKRGKAKKIPNVSCATCSKPFYKTESKKKLSKSGLFFCTRACKDEAQKIGGIDALQLPHYGSSKNYRRIAKSNLPNKCANCGYDKHTEILEVHHIDRDHDNNTLENLIILCPTCHQVDHFLSNDGRFS